MAKPRGRRGEAGGEEGEQQGPRRGLWWARQANGAAWEGCDRRQAVNGHAL